MADITLSGSVRANLLALQRTQSAIDTTNARLNTGKNVNTVIDDAAAFFSSKALNDRAGEFNDRKATIDRSISAVKAALTATNSIDSLLKQLKGILTAAKSSSAAERGDLQTQFNTVKNQIDQLVADASYQGTNLVNNSITKLDTQFSERSSSRLVVTAQRLSTYQTQVLVSQALSTANATGGSVAGLVASTTTGYQIQVFADATGIYYMTVVQSTVGCRPPPSFAMSRPRPRRSKPAPIARRLSSWAIFPRNWRTGSTQPLSPRATRQGTI